MTSVLGALRSLDDIPKCERLHTLQILCPNYDPDFKPLRGSMRGSYNGVEILLKVDSTDIHCDLKSPDATLQWDNQLIEPGFATWGEIWEVATVAVIRALYMVAHKQKMSMMEEGMYREH